jgi:hypothetical protein
MAIQDEIRQGEPRTYDGIVVDAAGDAVDCTGYSLRVRFRARSGTVIHEADSEVDASIAFTSAATGLYAFVLPESATAHGPGIYTVEVRTYNGGAVVGTVAYYDIRILDSLFVEG